MIKRRIQNLREEMKKRQIDFYLVPTADFHQSEYVGDYFKGREYLTGFTGSAGTVLVTEKEVCLWTDGRYFIQAEKQIQNTPVILYKMGEEGVLKISEYLEKYFPQGGCLGFDGRTVNGKMGEEYEKIVQKKQGRLYIEEDLLTEFWKERPEFPMSTAYVLPMKYTGESTHSKLTKVREKLKEQEATVHILTSLCDIAWLLNIRGSDIAHVPVILSFLMITENGCCWYVNPKKLGEDLKEYLKINGIQQKDYSEIYQDIEALYKTERVFIDKTMVNFTISRYLEKNVTVIHGKNPTEKMKAIKNPVELEHTKTAHRKDGIAVTKFMYWLKNNIGKRKITELSAAEVLENFRKEQENFLDLSFDTISAYGANAAMMHYKATETSDCELQEEGFYLVDSGAHYLEGTTDITRTIAFGNLTRQQKQHFTAVCRGNLNLASAIFLEGCNGKNLDILARQPLWELAIDYRCGTGHGVGHILNVHEGPNGFRWKSIPSEQDWILEEGMITTDEPGVYVEGQYGIRLENELVCRKGEKNEYGQFLYFENITYAPIDLDAILPEEMNEQEKNRLNQYHKKVYEVLSPYLTLEEQVWLKEYTRAI